MFDEQQQPKDTKGTAASFHLHPKRNAQKSLEAGRDIFDDVPYVKIVIVGNRTEMVHTPATEQHKVDYPREWQNFVNRNSEPTSGTPLGNLPGISAGLVEEARYFHVRTIEQLAEMPDTNVQNLGMGWPKLRQKARDYIAAAAGMAPLEKVRAENADLKSQMEALQRQVAALVAQKATEEPAAAAEQPQQSFNPPRRK